MRPRVGFTWSESCAARAFEVPPGPPPLYRGTRCMGRGQTRLCVPDSHCTFALRRYPVIYGWLADREQAVLDCCSEVRGVALCPQGPQGPHTGSRRFFHLDPPSTRVRVSILSNISSRCFSSRRGRLKNLFYRPSSLLPF